MILTSITSLFNKENRVDVLPSYLGVSTPSFKSLGHLFDPGQRLIFYIKILLEIFFLLSCLPSLFIFWMTRPFSVTFPLSKEES